MKTLAKTMLHYSTLAAAGVALFAFWFLDLPAEKQAEFLAAMRGLKFSELLTPLLGFIAFVALKLAPQDWLERIGKSPTKPTDEEESPK